MADTKQTPEDAPELASGVPAAQDAEVSHTSDVPGDASEDTAAPDAAEADASAPADDTGAAPAKTATPSRLASLEAPAFLSRIKWGRILVALVLAFILLAVGLFAWNRWYRFNDAADIIGTWRDVNSGSVMEVSETHLKLAKDAVYAYELDTFNKQITYTFSDAKGFSSYRFSEDRQQLVLEDGVETDWMLVLHFRDDPGFAEGDLAEGLTRLEKISSDVPSISTPGSKRPDSPLAHEPSSLATASSSSSGPISLYGPGSSKDSSSSSSSSASEEEEEDDGLIVGPDRNAKGYYDANGIFVPVSQGHYDANGNWVDSDETGYYDANGLWVKWPDESTGGYYDEYGNWVEPVDDGTDNSATEEVPTGESGYYDQNGNWVDTTAYVHNVENNASGNTGTETDGTTGQDGTASGLDGVSGSGATTDGSGGTGY